LVTRPIIEKITNGLVICQNKNMMKLVRSIFPLILILLTSLLVSCGGPSATTTPRTYSAERIEQIQIFVTPIETARERILELENLIEDGNWEDVDNLIHGPLGFLRRDISYLSNNLLPNDQKRASQIAKDLFFHIERLDAATKAQSYSAAVQQYNEVIKDFDTLLDLIPISK
jgi:photosystem II protein PsbQ